MTRAARWCLVALLAMAYTTAPAPAQSEGGEATEAGRVRFRTSCDEAVRADFARAVVFLHSFEYPESEKAFRAILKESPDCAMARWGIAMSLWHPLWAPPRRTSLIAGSAILKGAGDAARTQREAAYRSAIEAFYDGHDEISHSKRANAYSDRMESV